MKCRACFIDLDTNGSCMNICIRGTNSTLTLMDKLRQCVPEIDIPRISETYMCTNCCILLISAYNFRTMCLKTAEKFWETYRSDQEEIAKRKSGDFAESVVKKEQLSDDELIEKACNEIPELNRDREKINCRVSLDLLPNKLTEMVDTKGCCYICDYCHKIFFSHDGFLAHVDEHVQNIQGGTERFNIACRECNISFRTIKMFDLHMKLHPEQHNIYSFAQDEIPKSNSPPKRSRPNISLRQEVRQPLSFSGKETAKDNPTSVNLKTNRNTLRRTPCWLCGKLVFKLNYHIIKYHQYVNGPKCAICLKYFASSATLERHYSTHSDVETKCSQCQIPFPTISKFAQHLLASGCTYKLQDLPKTCPICKGRFATNNKVREHLYMNHKDLSLPVQCATCMDEFSTVGAIYEHYKCCKNMALVKMPELMLISQECFQSSREDSESTLSAEHQEENITENIDNAAGCSDGPDFNNQVPTTTFSVFDFERKMQEFQHLLTSTYQPTCEP